MNFIEKLDYLIKIRGLNKKKLSEQINMPYSTIDALYKVGYSNIKLSNFKKICDFFGVTMDYMARDELTEIEYYDPEHPQMHISAEEEYLVSHYRSADSLDRELALRALKADEKGDHQKMENIS